MSNLKILTKNERESCTLAFERWREEQEPQLVIHDDETIAEAIARLTWIAFRAGAAFGKECVTGPQNPPVTNEDVTRKVLGIFQRSAVVLNVVPKDGMVRVYNGEDLIISMRDRDFVSTETDDLLIAVGVPIRE